MNRLDQITSNPAVTGGVDRLVGHLAELAQAAARVAEDLRSGLAISGDAEACSGGGTSGERSVIPHGDSALVDSKQLAEILGVGVRTLRRWRHEGRAPRPLKGDGPLRWRRTDVDRWLQGRTS